MVCAGAAYWAETIYPRSGWWEECALDVGSFMILVVPPGHMHFSGLFRAFEVVRVP